MAEPSLTYAAAAEELEQFRRCEKDIVSDKALVLAIELLRGATNVLSPKPPEGVDWELVDLIRDFLFQKGMDREVETIDALRAQLRAKSCFKGCPDCMPIGWRAEMDGLRAQLRAAKSEGAREEREAIAQMVRDDWEHDLRVTGLVEAIRASGEGRSDG
jgi:hypothetical protein